MSVEAPVAETLSAEFSGPFQLELLKIMYHEPDFLRMVSDAIRPEHFDSKTNSVYAQILLDFAKAYPKDTITRDVVFNEIGKLVRLKKIASEDQPGYVKTFIDIATPAKAPEYVKAEVKRFVLAKTMEVELVESVNLLKHGKYKEIVDNLTKALVRVDTTEKAPEVKVIGSIAERMEKLKDPEAFLKKDGISTGLDILDNVFYRRGVGRGEMIVVCGSPSRGKSIWLSTLAMAAVMKGHSVLYYTLEMAADIVMNRIDAMATGIPFVDLIRHADEVANRWGILNEKFTLGEIHLHDLPGRSLTPNMIRRHLSEYNDKGIFPSYLIVDYADIMASDRKIDERRLEHGDVYEQLRAIAKESGIAVATASQANRDSLNKRDVDIDSLAEDFSKAMTADYVIGLSQIKSDAAVRKDGHGTGNMRAFIAKNRNGVKGGAPEFLTDFVKMRVSLEDGERFDKEHFGHVIY